MLKIINDKKPSLIQIDMSEFKAFLVVEGKKYSLPLKNEATAKQFKSVVENLNEYVERIDDGFLIGFKLDWNKEVPSIEETAFKSNEEEEYSEEGTFNNLDRMIQSEELLEVVITSTGTLIKDGKVSESKFNSNTAKKIYDGYSQEESNAVGMIERNIVSNGNEYRVLMWKVGDEVSVKFTRKILDLKDLLMVMPSEMKYRLERIKNGLIVTTMDKLIKMEHIIPMLKSADGDFEKMACSVGDNLVVTDLPTQDTINNLKKLKETQYKYILVSGIETPQHLTEVLNLMYSGKTIIIGFENDSVYSNLISLLSLCGGETFNNNKVLMSTIGFIHPVVKIKNNKLSLEDSECVTLSGSKANSIIGGDLSKEKFNTLIERPAKVYRLDTSNSGFLTQEDELKGLLERAVKEGASDVHLAVGTSPMFRIQGKLRSINPNLKLMPEVLNHITSLFVTTELQKKILLETNELNLPYSVTGIGRFRVQISTQRGTYYIVVRHTPTEIPTAKDIRLPQEVLDVVLNNPKGLIIITGPTGSGKSTTSAVLIDELKRSGQYAITSLADPIEFLYTHGNGIVVQREIPSDVISFDGGINSAFRSDPDIMEIAEMRTTESIHATMRFANSGHLVATTYHTSSVKGTFDAILNRVESDRQAEVISSLSQNLLVIINQTLVEGKNGKRVPVFEYLIPNRTVRKYIADNKLTAIESEMKTSARGDKTVGTWADYELLELYKRGEITEEVMNKYLVNKDVRVDFRGSE